MEITRNVHSHGRYGLLRHVHLEGYLNTSGDGRSGANAVGSYNIVFCVAIVVIAHRTDDEAAAIVLCRVAVEITSGCVGTTCNRCSGAGSTFAKAKCGGGDVGIGYNQRSVVARCASSRHGLIHSPCVAIDEFVLDGLVFSNSKYGRINTISIIVK